MSQSIFIDLRLIEMLLHVDVTNQMVQILGEATISSSKNIIISDFKVVSDEEIGVVVEFMSVSWLLLEPAAAIINSSIHHMEGIMNGFVVLWVQETGQDWDILKDGFRIADLVHIWLFAVFMIDMKTINCWPKINGKLRVWVELELIDLKIICSKNLQYILFWVQSLEEFTQTKVLCFSVIEGFLCFKLFIINILVFVFVLNRISIFEVVFWCKLSWTFQLVFFLAQLKLGIASTVLAIADSLIVLEVGWIHEVANDYYCIQNYKPQSCVFDTCSHIFWSLIFKQKVFIL